jgi:hypothetical protein
MVFISALLSAAINLRNKGEVILALNQTPCHEDVCGNCGIAPLILKLNKRWRVMVSYTFLPLYAWEKCPRHP